MKNAIIVISALFLSFTTAINNPVDRIGVKGPLEFGQTTFKLVWSDNPNDQYYVQEYLPEGEKLENFNQMLTIHLFDTDVKPKDAVSLKIGELTERKKTDPVCNYQVAESPDGKEFIVDFLIGEGKDKQTTVVEFNIYRYKQVEIAKGKQAIMVYAFSKRSYGEDITAFFKTFKEDRTVYLNEMILKELPTVAIEDNSKNMNTLMVYGDDFTFGVKEPDGWTGDINNAEQFYSNIIFYKSIEEAKSGGAVVQVYKFNKQDERTEQDLEYDVKGYKKKYKKLKQQDLVVSHKEYKCYGKTVYVENRFYQYTVYVNPGPKYKSGISVAMNISNRPATAEELKAFQEIIASFVML